MYTYECYTISYTNDIVRLYCKAISESVRHTYQDMNNNETCNQPVEHLAAKTEFQVFNENFCLYDAISDDKRAINIT